MFHQFLFLFILYFLFNVIFFTIIGNAIISTSSSYQSNSSLESKISQKQFSLFSSSTHSLDEEKYTCLGSCFCYSDQNDNGRRRSSSLVASTSRSLVFLVSALSISIATRKARKYFSEDCEKKLKSSECPSNKIFSEVENCQLYLSYEDEEEEEVEDDDEEEEEEEIYDQGEHFKVGDYIVEEEAVIVNFICRGRCKINLGLKRKKAIYMAKRFNCKKLKTEGEVEVDCTEMPDSVCELYAKYAFQKKHLNEFCKWNSEAKYEFQYSYKIERGRKTWVRVFLCSSLNPGENLSQLVECRKLREDELLKNKPSSKKKA